MWNYMCIRWFINWSDSTKMHGATIRFIIPVVFVLNLTLVQNVRHPPSNSHIIAVRNSSSCDHFSWLMRFGIENATNCRTCKYRGAHKSLNRPGRKTALGSMSRKCSISTTSRRELSSGPPPCKARCRRKFTRHSDRNISLFHSWSA